MVHVHFAVGNAAHPHRLRLSLADRAGRNWRRRQISGFSRTWWHHFGWEFARLSQCTLFLGGVRACRKPAPQELAPSRLLALSLRPLWRVVPLLQLSLPLLQPLPLLLSSLLLLLLPSLTPPTPSDEGQPAALPHPPACPSRSLHSSCGPSRRKMQLRGRSGSLLVSLPLPAYLPR